MITLRPAHLNDAVHLYVWRNHPETRARFFDTEPVSWESHRVWLRNTLEDPAHKVYMAIRDGETIGTVRFHIAKGEAEVSVTVAPECRGAGIGTEILRLGTVKALESCGRVTARIKADNIASQRAFAKAGYRVIEGTAEEVVMVADQAMG